MPAAPSLLPLYSELLIFEAEGTDCLHAPPPGS
jgi:hypothetical protein